MKDVPLLPEVHLFVCANRREADSPLGPGCGEEGEAVFDDLKRRTLSAGLATRVWVTRTSCLGICPKEGATVACYPAQKLIQEVRVSDGLAILARALGSLTRGNK